MAGSCSKPLQVRIETILTADTTIMRNTRRSTRHPSPSFSGLVMAPNLRGVRALVSKASR